MIGAEDAHYTFEYKEHFKILPTIHDWSLCKNRIKEGVRVPEGFVYASDNNQEWMTHTELQEWIDSNIDEIGQV